MAHDRVAGRRERCRTRLVSYCFIAYVSLQTVACVHTLNGPLSSGDRFLRDRLVMASDVDLAEQDGLVRGLVALREDMSTLLGLHESNEPIYVYLYANGREFESFVNKKYPELRGRRAFFVENALGLSVYAKWSEHIEEDLRHEVAHGYLHAVAPQVPLWLDEGIAEFFEVASGHEGFNERHAKTLSRAQQSRKWQPDLPRLEQLTASSQMRQIDYAEAWLWVHFFLRTTEERRRLLLEYLAELQQGIVPASLVTRIAADEAEVALHLAALGR